jgi:hypothetical protein
MIITFRRVASPVIRAELLVCNLQLSPPDGGL